MTAYKAATSHSSTLRRTLAAQAVALALTALANPSAWAADVCGAGLTTINTVQLNTDNCTLNTGESLSLVAPGSITFPAAAVLVGVGNTAGTLTNSGTITSSGNSGLNITGTIGGITNSGAINGNNGIFIDGGTVSSITNNAGGTIGSVAGAPAINILGGSTVGAITNSGAITGQGAGAIHVDGNSTTGVITNNGTISAGTQSINIRPGSTVAGIVNNSGGTLTGTLLIASGAIITGGVTNSGTINASVQLGGATLNLNGTTGSITQTVQSVAAGSVVNVNGTFTTAGTFLGIGTFNIANGGRLNMGNNITAINFNNAGTLAVVAGTTSTITGNYTHTAGGVFESGLTNSTTFGKLAVTGTVNLAASNALRVNVVGAPVLAINTVLPGVITSTGALTAGPTFTVTDNSALVNFRAAVNGNAIDLTVVPGTNAVTAVTTAGSVSGLGAAALFDQLIELGAGAPAPLASAITALASLESNTAVADAVLQTLPFSDSTTQATLTNLHGVNQIVLARSEAGGNKGLSSGDGYASGDGFASSFSNRGAWVKPLGSWANQKDRSGAFGYDASTYGIVVGADGDLSKNTRLGAAFAYTRSNVDSNSGLQAADVDSYGVTLYGTQNLDQGIELNWQADYAHHQNEGSRRIAFVNQTATSDYNSNSVHLGIGVERSMVTGVFGPKTVFTPSLRADYTRIRDDGYTETGAGALNLVVNGRSTDQLIVAVNGKLSHALNETTTLNANLGVGYDTQAEQSSVTSAFQGGGAAFSTAGINPPKTLIRGGLGLVVNTKDAMEITARYDVEARKDFTNQTASIKFKMPF